MGAAIPDHTKMKVVLLLLLRRLECLYNPCKYKPEANAGKKQQTHRPLLPQEKPV